MQREMYVKSALSKSSSILGNPRPSNLEQELVISAKDGSPDAFDQLVERYRARIFRIAYNIVRHYHDAEDVTQIAFLKAFNKLLLFRGDSSFYTWLASITVNEALMRIRRGRKEVLMDESGFRGEWEVVDDFIHALGPNPEQVCSNRELRRIVVAAINKLKPAQRLVFQLRHIEGLSIHEIAESLNLTLPAVKTRLHRSRITMRRSLYYLLRPQKGSMAVAREQDRTSYSFIRAASRPLHGP